MHHHPELNGQRKPGRTAMSRRRVLSWSLAAGAVAASAPALAACGGEGGGSGEVPPQELTVGVVTDIASFDPYYNGTVNFILMQNINEFLIDYDDELNPLPAALTEWEFSDDLTSVVLTLRPDVQLQTGKVWTADDLVYGLERAADPARGQQLSSPMAIVENFEKVADDQVELTFMNAVNESLVTDLLQSFPIVDADHNDEEFLATQAASGGPFQVESRSPGTDVVITKWPEFWDAENVTLDKATFRVFDNEDSMVSALQAGEMDLIYGFPARHAAQLEGQFEILEGYPGALVDCIRFNTNIAPYDHLELRQAIARAVDRQRIVDEVYFGYGQPLFLPWGPNSPANDPAYAEINSYDLEAASQLLQQSGAPMTAEALADGSNSGALQMLQIIQQSLSEIGFDLKITTLEAQAFRQRMLAGDFGMLFGGLGNSSKSPTRVGTNSIYRTVDNPVLKDKVPQDYVDAVARAESAGSDEEAKQAYDALNEVLSREAFAIPICSNVTLIAHKPTVNGVARDVDDRLMLDKVTIAAS